MRKPKLQYWILAADLAWGLIALTFSYVLRYGFKWYGPTEGSFLTFLPPFLVAIAMWTIIFVWMQLDGFQHGWNPSAVLAQLFIALTLVMLVFLAGGYVLRVFISRLTLAYFFTLLFVGFVSIRYFAHRILGSRYLAGAVRRVLIVGNGPVAREMAAKLAQHPEMLCQVVGFLYSVDTPFDSRIGADVNAAMEVNTLGVINLLRENKVDEVIITLSNPRSAEVMNLANQCRRQSVTVSIVPHPYELYLSRPQLLDIGGLPVVQLREAKLSPTTVVLKRALDIGLAIPLLMFTLPFVAVGAILLMGRRGGPFVRELRCGQGGTNFLMYRLNSDRNCTQLPFYEFILQHLSITEMPQLWNVLRGDMSLVGPRPESPERVRHYSEWQSERLKVKPGITGLAQVHGLRQQHSSEEKTRFDLQYMMRVTVFQDIAMLLQTVWTLTGRLLHLYQGGAQGAESTSRRESAHFLDGSLSSAHSTQSSTD